MTNPAEYAADLNHSYEQLHTAKEDAFWTHYMGLADDADEGRKTYQAAEVALNAFLQDPARLQATRDVLAAAEAAGDTPEETLGALRGWAHTLASHVIETAEGRALAEELVAQEGELARARATMKLGYQLPGQDFVEASSVKLGVMLGNEKDEPTRRAAWMGLSSIESHVLANGFVDVVRTRNRLGKSLGGEDYYDWKVRRTEGMSKQQIFLLLDDLDARTRDRAKESLAHLEGTEGPDAVRPWNLKYYIAGDITTEQDPYFPFSRSFARWGRSFAALGIDYRDAELVLDLVDRKGKYENGFMHGPVPAWREAGRFKPARIHFTANAIPGMVGSGRRATETFFHEGGHAAHFANIDMPSPCFSQEFAPTSVAFAETQSMFLDSLLQDADWQTRYAKSRDGEPLPFELIEKGIRAMQPYAAWSLRAQLAVSYAERAIYEIPDAELSAERIVEEIRAQERRFLFLDESSPRPTLSIPHLLVDASSAYYHGYTLALMAVYQTRNYFMRRDGHLMDNPRIGPDLKRAYWQPGNSKRFPEFVRALTGEEVSAKALADHVNRDVETAVAEARRRVEQLAKIPENTAPVDLRATIRVVHGHEEVANTSGGFAPAASAFQSWVESQEN